MAIPISNVTRRVVYAASGTGPYAFSFEILANTDIAVYEDDTLLTLTTDYSVTINANGTGSITLTSSPTGAQIAIVGNRTIARTTDFTTGGDFFANTLNDELDQQTIFAQQNQEAVQRALSAPQTDPTTINMTLPRASVRANKSLAFDSNGNPVIGEVIGDNRGNWASGTSYNKRDIVKDTSNGNIYYANTAHTSSGSQPISTNTDSAKWDLLVDTEAAVDAQAAAEAAQSAAENAQTAAEAAATNVADSASAAATSATNAATSASSASTSATNAASSASTASTAATNAGNSATAAAASESAAATSATNASSSASTALTAATNASSSASAAATSATNAASSASAASTSASNAATSETNAGNSATAAASSATSAAASYDSFDDRYLGAKSSNPTLDNDGDPLLTGALYFNTTVGEMRVYNGTDWVAATVSPDTIGEVEFSATAGQTTYEFTSGYRVGFVYVWVNGVMLADADYTATDGTNITFTSALALNDEVRVITFKAAGSVAVADVSGLQDALDAKIDVTELGVTVQAYDADTAKTDVEQTFTANQTFTEVTDTVHTITDGTGFQIDPANGAIQVVTLGANRTPQATNFADGQVVLLGINDGSARTITWTTIGVNWVKAGGSAAAPTLATSGFTWVLLWKVGGVVYGSEVGKP